MSKTYIIGIDNIQGGQDSTTLATVVKVVEDAGNTVINAGVVPNVVQSKAKSTSCDVMVQIAGGRCIGTSADLCQGVSQGYYKAKRAMHAFASWTATRYITCEDLKGYKFKGKAWDDNFSNSSLLNTWLVKLDGSQTFSEWATQDKVKQVFGWCCANSAEELGKAILTESNGGSSDEEGESQPSSIKEALKKLLAYYDGEIECRCVGDEVIINKIPSPLDSRLVVAEGQNIVAGSVTVKDYLPEKPNKLVVTHNFGDAIVYQNDKLIERFGEKVQEMEAVKKVTVTVEVEDTTTSSSTTTTDTSSSTDTTSQTDTSSLTDGTDTATTTETKTETKTEEVPVESYEEALKFAEIEWAKIRRDNGHSISLKVVDGDDEFTEHQWVRVYIPSFGEDGKMYITKIAKGHTTDGDPTASLEMYDYPPGFGELQEETNTDEEEDSEEETTSGETTEEES